MAFKYQKQNGAMLTQSQEFLLETIENLPSPFSGVHKLKDLRKLTGVNIIVSDRNSLNTRLQGAVDSINNQIIEWHKIDVNRHIFNQIEGDIYARLKWAQDQLTKRTLLGLYSRNLLWFQNAAPTVSLFADNIRDYAKSSKMAEDDVFAFVFIHEMMHAYYDAFYSDGFPSREQIEEAFSEYGMLTFISKNQSSLPSTLLVNATNHVQAKITKGPSEYGFGYDLFRLTNGGDPKMIDRYRDISNRIDLDVIRNWKSSYFNNISNYPNQVTAAQCFVGIKEILDYDWGKPKIIIQRRIKGSGTLSGGACVLPGLRGNKEWALTATKIGWATQCPLIRYNDFILLLTDVMKVMKNEGFESYLSLSADKILFLGHTFSSFTTTLSSRCIPEGLCIKGTNVYPELHIFIPPGQIGNILDVLNILFGGPFTIVHDNLNYTLFGPANCESLFKSVSMSSKYAIIDKGSKKTLAQIKEMSKTVLFVVGHYCSNNPSVTLAQLQKVFAGMCHSSQNMGIIESASNVAAYKSSHPGDSKRRYFENDPIVLSNGDIIMVSNQWAKDGSKQNFSKFIAIADSLGYEIK